MRAIQPVHTRRLSVALKELTIGQTQELCSIPYQYEQRTVTAFLRAVCTPLVRQSGEPTVDDPLLWSVNERMHATIFYMAAMLEDGPDFAVGEGHLHDYLLAGTDYVEAVPFEFQGEALIYTPLHGYQAEAIETLIETGQYPKSYFSWNAAVMAACMRGAEDEPIPYSNPAQYQKALAEQIERVLAMPQSTFMGLFEAFQQTALSAQHFVHAIVTEYGVVAAQVTEPDEQTGVPQLGTARFCPRAAISQGALDLMASPGASEG